MKISKSTPSAVSGKKVPPAVSSFPARKENTKAASDSQGESIRSSAKHDALPSDTADCTRGTSGYGHFSDLTPPGESQRFIKNNRYFTICIYGVVMIIVTAIIFKAIIDIKSTKAMFGQLFTILGPFIFGALLAYVLNPMVHVFYRLIDKLAGKVKIKLNHSLHTVIAILITYLIVFGFIVLTLFYVIPELVKNIMDFANYIPQAYESFLDLLSMLQERFPNAEIEAITKPLTDTIPDMIAAVRDMAANMVPAIYTISASIASWIVNLLITIIVSVYMLYDKRKLMRGSWKIIYALLPEKHIASCHEILAECNHLFSSFVVGKFIDSTIIGILCFILMVILKLEYAPLISLIVGVTNMIPYFGPFIGAIPGILILLFVNPIHGVIFGIMVLCLQQFDGLILGPKILGDSTGMTPLWIIFAVTVGGSVAGVIGMFLGVPLVAIANYLLDRYLQYRLNKKHISEAQVDEALRGIELDD